MVSNTIRKLRFIAGFVATLNGVHCVDEVSVLTYNTQFDVWKDPAKLAAVKDVIWDDNGVPRHDITVLQEATKYLHDCLKTNKHDWYDKHPIKARKQKFQQHGFTYFCSLSGKEGAITIVKNEILDNKNFKFRGDFLGNAGRTAQLLTIDNPTNPLVIMNIHAPHYDTQKYNTKKGNSKGAPDKGNNEQAVSHLKSMSDMFKEMFQMKMPDNAYIIVGGDFNAEFHQRFHTISLDSRNGLVTKQLMPTSAFASCGGRKFDFILTSAEITGQHPIKPSGKASDHKPLMAKIKLHDPPAGYTPPALQQANAQSFASDQKPLMANIKLHDPPAGYTPPALQQANAQSDPIDDKPSSCFPAHAVVDVLDESSGEFVTMRMDSVEIGMLVKDSASGSSSVVTGFVHKSSDVANVAYLALSFDSNSNRVEISPYHNIFLADGSDVFAKDVKIGDMLANGHIVTRIDDVVHNSLYAPVTESGIIVVNDAPASCYANVPHAIAHLVTSTPMMIQNYVQTVFNGLGFGFNHHRESLPIVTDSV